MTFRVMARRNQGAHAVLVVRELMSAFGVVTGHRLRDAVLSILGMDLPDEMDSA